MSIKNIREILAERSEDLKKYEDKFLDRYRDALLKNDLEHEQKVPTDYFRPSSLGGGCKRMLYFQRKGVPKEERDIKDEWTYNIVGICDSGTDRHERIQKIVSKMEGVETLDIAEIVNEANMCGVNTEVIGWNKEHTECRCKNEDLGIYFQPDGAFKFDGKECLLEIKTINTFQFKKLLNPKPEHLRQATLYAMGLNMKYVLFLYEERNFTQHKLFLVEITDELRGEMLDKIEDINKHLSEGKVPPKEEDKCTYCDYKKKCREIEEDVNNE